MKTIVLLILITCPSLSSSAQSSLSFKIYQNTDIFKSQPTEGNIHFGRISLAIDLLTKKGIAHEVEFFIPESSKPIEKFRFPIQYNFGNGAKFDREASSYSLRYEIHKLLANQSDRINFIFGAGINPYYVQLEDTPTTPNAYYNSLTLYGVALNVIPRLYYRLNRLFSIDLNVPIRMYNLREEKYRQDNPILPIRQQRHHHLNHLFLEPVYTIRLGLRYSLGK